MNEKKEFRAFCVLQKTEITEYHVYKKLAKRCKRPKNKKLLNKIAKEELSHYKLWKKHTKKHLKPNTFKVWFYVLLSKIFGLTFGLALMERNERRAQRKYLKISKRHPRLKVILKDEHKHEKQLIELIHEERLHYISSIVLGINDALVELTGAMAGLTLALQNTRLIGLVGLITGIAASLSMASSEFLSMREEKENLRSPWIASFYTGVAYFVTVIILVFPFLVVNDLYLALAWTIGNAILIIALYTFYISVTRSESFPRRFGEMALISLSVAAFSFLIGYVIRVIFGIEV